MCIKTSIEEQSSTHCSRGSSLDVHCSKTEQADCGRRCCPGATSMTGGVVTWDSFTIPRKLSFSLKSTKKSQWVLLWVLWEAKKSVLACLVGMHIVYIGTWLRADSPGGCMRSWTCSLRAVKGVTVGSFFSVTHIPGQPTQRRWSPIFAKPKKRDNNWRIITCFTYCMQCLVVFVLFYKVYLFGSERESEI